MKKLVVGLFIALAAVTSQAEYLWWTVNQDVDTSYNDNIASYLTQLKADGTIQRASQVYANIVAVDSSGTKVGEYDMGFTSEWGTGSQAQYVSMDDLLGDKASQYQSYSYYIEIGSMVSGYENIGINQSKQTYDQMAASFTSDLTPVASANVWHGGGEGGYKAAPEPTSAMLMLLGVAGLALKRKQKKA